MKDKTNTFILFINIQDIMGEKKVAKHKNLTITPF